MKKFFYLAIFAIILSGCSSSPTVNENVSVRTNVNISELNNPNQNSLAPANAGNGLNEPVFTDASNGSQQVIKGDKRQADKNLPPLVPNAKPITQAAPDNSEMQGSMNPQGQPFETRTFKNHPVLLKVERIYVSLENPVIKVYMRNGKTVDLSKDKIANPMQASAEEIINAVNASNPNPAATKQR